MFSEVIIPENELRKYGSIENHSLKATALLNHQKRHWKLLKDNFRALDDIQTKSFDYDKIYVKTQFNPSRIISSSAKVDKKSISSRACFLCKENLPEVQKGINFKDKYIILCNPYPIFSQHLTIPFKDHIPQNIESSFQDFLDLSFELRDNFFVFYNGPRCGASAPDHLHFQAGLKNSTPLEDYYQILIDDGIILHYENEATVKYISKILFSFFVIQSKHRIKIEDYAFRIINHLKDLQSVSEEPLLNIIALFENNQWNIFIIPRRKHRPRQFFLEDKEQILISPASVDMAGLLITPRKEDFERMNRSLIIDVYNQVLYRENIVEGFKVFSS